MKILLSATLITFLITIPTLILAGQADVLNVEVENHGKNSYTFRTTVQHGDSGWKHYADKWEILDEQGKVLSTRILHHPHVNEQPFTRSLSAVKISDIVKRVTIRAHDSVHKYGGKTITLDLP